MKLAFKRAKYESAVHQLVGEYELSDSLDLAVRLFPDLAFPPHWWEDSWPLSANCPVGRRLELLLGIKAEALVEALIDLGGLPSTYVMDALDFAKLKQFLSTFGKTVAQRRIKFHLQARVDDFHQIARYCKEYHDTNELRKLGLLPNEEIEYLLQSSPPARKWTELIEDDPSQEPSPPTPELRRGGTVFETPLTNSEP